MRPVNLLPPSARPYQASGKRGGAAYVVLGVLAALLLVVATYVLTTNQVTNRKNEIARAQQETQAAQSKAAGLERYGEFTQVANARIQAVGMLAENRIDYERLLRELARVLPSGVWLTQLDAEATANGASGSGSSSSTSSTTPSGPSVHLLGCAPSQNAVATTLVRLRAIHGSGDVQLNDSGKALQFSGGGSSSSGSSSGGTGCGSQYGFDILVNLTPEITGFGDAGRKVPAVLGGGS